MRDHDGRTPAQDLLQRPLHQPLGSRVQMCGRLVQDHDPRVAQQDPGQREPLFLASREPVAALAHHRVVTVRQSDDQLVDLRGLAC
jgi:hypothetical protein